MSTIRHTYVRTLDGWRAVAILLVIICHGGNAVFSTGGLCPSEFLYSVTRRGALGVDVFFGISGLLICGRLLEEYEQTGTISLGNFYLRRIFRILPPAFAYLLIVGGLGLVGTIPVGRWNWLSSAFFFRNYVPTAPDGWYTGHFWSLAVEEHFYLICPGLLLLCGPRRAPSVVGGLVLAVGVWRSLDFHHAWLSGLLPDASFYERTDVRLDALFAGCWIALELSIPRRRAAIARWMSPLPWLGAIAAYAGCVIYSPPMALLWEAILIPFILAGTILHADGLAGRILETSSLRWIGRISYSLYLWQQLFLVPHDLPRSLGLVQLFPFNLAALFAIAAASYYLLERPLIAFGHRLERQPRQILAAQLATSRITTAPHS